ncbi:MAG: arginine--tRNA ligase [Candidatus Jettenia sp.]|uniref:Arginine--tRNA ligase n=1 Tax=Candidatus Jettenia caeni TaxID=247490 RepID=I3IH88_9BACT|nr:arginine--tRNA ligase [Candidatus Jettenia sp. AMX1]MBC6929199.1 arginine--tRNA ligase [Candidatus Jettenia sp.]WKZ16412.1 MAG: arginine--tRNA ligase [Candidatus Jettenia caeni]KAA0250156.1 MAG: arginine--tRNA ligase [Candidatus Jettenia sp. AMX1]MCE7880568.1 arginine--tRNA ligase [Candidatus Jettenia sp. AMX1]MCQ3927369.1 arginine--tRNA ligase [Candidatus Jettenia sp.]
MDYFVKSIASLLKEKTNLREDEIEKLIEIPPVQKMGDYAFPCYTLSKVLKKPPNSIAEELSKTLHAISPVAEIRAIGPYVNFFVDKTIFSKMLLKKVHEEQDLYGSAKVGSGKTIVIDYSSPNIAKHLAVHHLRSALIGNAIYHIYKTLGYNCVGINHLGDWGTQFGQLIVAYKKWGDESARKVYTVTDLNNLYVRFHQEAAKNAALEDEAREWFKKLEAGDSEAKELWQHFKDISLKEFQKIYDMLEIHFDAFIGESFYNTMVEDTVKRIKKKGLTKISEEALIVDLEPYNMPPCLLRKKDDATLYATRDIAAAEYRMKTYTFDNMVYVVGSEQKLHFKQVYKVLELMGYDWANRCVHVDFGLMKFKDGKMSTRKGKVILLEDLLIEAIERVRKIIEEKNPSLENKDAVAKEVGIGAVIFTDLSTRRTKDVVFEWESVLNFEGETGPYVQYTHARLCSILRKYGKPVTADINYELLKEDEAFALVKNLSQFPTTILKAAEFYEPSLISNYLIDVCASLNRFYNTHRVLSDDEELTRARILLVDSTRQVIKNGLSILGIHSPDRM